MNNHTTSLELSRELWEAGLRVESEFRIKQDGKLVWPGNAYDPLTSYPAYLASELGELLPFEIKLDGLHYCGDYKANIFSLGVEKNEEGWMYYYCNGQESYYVNKTLEYHKSECDARAKMLLHLIREGLVDVISLNEKV